MVSFEIKKAVIKKDRSTNKLGGRLLYLNLPLIYFS